MNYDISCRKLCLKSNAASDAGGSEPTAATRINAVATESIRTAAPLQAIVILE